MTSLVRSAAGQIVDELLRRSAGEAAMGHFPLVCLAEKLLICHMNFRIAARESRDDLLELLRARLEVADRAAEARGQGQLLLNGVVRMQLIGAES